MKPLRLVRRSPVASLARAASLGGVTLALAGCGQDFPPVSRVNGVRVFAVRMEPHGSGTPGETLSLHMTYADGAVAPSVPGDEPPAEDDPLALEIAWLGGCHNPPSRFFYACAPILHEIAARLDPESAVSTDTQAWPAGFFGTGPSFEVAVPENILSSAPRIATDPVHFGVSYVFFAVCAGALRPRPDIVDGVPLDCVDRDTRAPLGARDFVVGYTTVYTYEGIPPNENPVVPSVSFNAGPLTGPACETPGSCVAVVPPCRGDRGACPKYRIAPELDATSVERMPDGSHEILWASYFAAGGEIIKATQLVSDRARGRVADFASEWRAPATPGRARIWVTVNDQRGGVAASTFDVLVSD